MVTGEQIIRVAGIWLLLDLLQINALIIFYLIGLIAKGVVFYFVNDKYCFKHKFYFWQSVGAPVLAGITHCFVLMGLSALIWKGDMVSSGILFFVGILPTFPLYIFFYSFFGGWDSETLKELKLAAENSNFMKWFSWLLWKISDIAANISPLHDKFPIDIREQAMVEARKLTQLRVKL